MGLNNYLVAGG